MSASAWGSSSSAADPWNTIAQRYPINTKVNGKVSSVADFGVFVEIEEGIEGLIHISQFSSERVDKPSSLFKVGDQVEALVVQLDPKERRIGLSIRALKQHEEREEMQAYLKREHEAQRFSLEDILNEELRLDRDDGSKAAAAAGAIAGHGGAAARGRDRHHDQARDYRGVAGGARTSRIAKPRRSSTRCSTRWRSAGARRRIEIRGFGSFGVKQRRARQGRNPKTGALVAVEAKRIPFFRAGKELRSEVNGAGAKARRHSRVGTDAASRRYGCGRRGATPICARRAQSDRCIFCFGGFPRAERAPRWCCTPARAPRDAQPISVQQRPSDDCAAPPSWPRRSCSTRDERALIGGLIAHAVGGCATLLKPAGFNLGANLGRVGRRRNR